MPDISLEDLLQAKKTEAAAQPVLMNQQQEIQQVTAQTEALTPAQRQQVEEIKEKINLMDSGYALQFGSTAQKDMAAFSDSLLSQVRTKDSGQVGELLTDLSGKINDFSESQNDSFVKKIPLIGSLVNKGENMLSSYEKLSTKVAKIQSELEKAKTTMMKEIQNRLPPAGQPVIFYGADSQNRTGDLRVTNPMHYRLCYISIYVITRESIRSCTITLH